MMGSTTKVSTVSWIGNVTGHVNVGEYVYPPYVYVQGIWKAVMATANSIYGGGDFPAPDETMMKGKSVSVPAIDGLTLKQAQDLIESVGLTFKDGGEMDSEKTKGTVVKSDPASGQPTSVGAEITVYTSNQTLVNGPGTTLNLSQQAATAALIAGGWVPKVIPAPAPTTDCSYTPAPTPTVNPTPSPVQSTCPAPNPNQGKVIAQDIVGGYIKPGATITITVQQ